MKALLYLLFIFSTSFSMDRDFQLTTIMAKLKISEVEKITRIIEINGIELVDKLIEAAELIKKEKTGYPEIEAIIISEMINEIETDGIESVDVLIRKFRAIEKDRAIQAEKEREKRESIENGKKSLLVIAKKTLYVFAGSNFLSNIVGSIMKKKYITNVSIPLSILVTSRYIKRKITEMSQEEKTNIRNYILTSPNRREFLENIEKIRQNIIQIRQQW